MRLDLSHNEISDLWPAGRPERGFLDLSGNRIADLSPLSGLTVPRHAFRPTLALADNDIRDLAPLAGSKLRSLDLSHNEVSDLSPLADAEWAYRWRNWIQLQGNRISDASPLVPLLQGDVAFVDLGHNTIVQVPAFVEDHPYFDLDLAGNRIDSLPWSDAGYRYVNAWYLNVQGNRLTAPPAARSIEAYTLLLGGNAINDIALLLADAPDTGGRWQLLPHGQSLAQPAWRPRPLSAFGDAMDTRIAGAAR